MFYEHSTYSELWKTLPSPGAKIKVPQGNYVLEGVDLRTEMARVSIPEGGETAIPVADFARFKETILRGGIWQKEEKNDVDDQDRKHIFPRGRVSKLCERARTYETPEASSRNNKKFKPEKISIEEHIAESVNAERANVERTSQPLQSEAPQKLQKSEKGAKKRHRRHKGAPPDLRKREEQVQEQGTREYSSPTGQRLKHVPMEDARKDVKDGAQAHSVHTRGAHDRRPKYKGGSQVRERHGSRSAGAAEKEDS